MLDGPGEGAVLGLEDSGRAAEPIEVAAERLGGQLGGEPGGPRRGPGVLTALASHGEETPWTGNGSTRGRGGARRGWPGGRGYGCWRVPRRREPVLLNR